MSESLRILQIITARGFYGAEHMLVYLCDGLRARGHQLFVACKPNSLLQEALATCEIPHFVLPIGGKSNILAPLRLARLARHLNVDLIHTHLSSASLWGSLAGRLAGIPVLASVHAMNSPTCFRLADHIATCSEGVRQHLLRHRFPATRVDVLYNGLPARLFTMLPSAAILRQELGIPAEVPVIGVIAHLSPRKGQRYLIEALPLLRERFPSLICLLIGDGRERPALERLCQKLGVSRAVRFLGFRADAIRLMAALDAIVLPAIEKEGLGLVLIEAGFLGKPTVASRLPGIDEVVVHGVTGWLTPPCDSRALAEAISRLLADRRLAEAFGQAAREHMLQHFTQEAMAARAEEIYWRVLERCG